MWLKQSSTALLAVLHSHTQHCLKNVFKVRFFVFVVVVFLHFLINFRLLKLTSTWSNMYIMILRSFRKERVVYVKRNFVFVNATAENGYHLEFSALSKRDQKSVCIPMVHLWVISLLSAALCVSSIYKCNITL